MRIRVWVRVRIRVEGCQRLHPRFVIKHASMGRIKRVKTRHKQGQESNKGAKERGWGLQKRGNF